MPTPHCSLLHLDHRPWELPTGNWKLRQNWRDLLFIHYPIAVSEVRHLVPDSVEIEEFNGTTWIGIVPFRMDNVMIRPFPNLPWISAFPELNVRLYVKYQDKPGVWFLSLDAGNWLAVRIAKQFFLLPYFNANMHFNREGQRVEYTSSRQENENSYGLKVSYWPTSAIFKAKKGSLDHFLTERYCLYTTSPDGQLYRAQIHHRPWPLQKAEACITENTLLQKHGLSVPTENPVLHFTQGVEVIVWGLEKV